MNSDDVEGVTRERIEAALAAFEPRAAGEDLGAVGETPASPQRAAVAIAVGRRRDGVTAFLLTVRPDRMRAHPGQFALPGGRVDSGESAAQGALRELHEELGIEVDEAAVLGRLDDYVTRSGYVISPFVVWVGDLLDATIANPDEVAIVLTPTMAELDVEPRFVTIPESDRPVVQWPYAGSLIHAPTGAIIYQFREVVLHGRPTRVDHLEQPVFAWR